MTKSKIKVKKIKSEEDIDSLREGDVVEMYNKPYRHFFALRNQLSFNEVYSKEGSLEKYLIYDRKLREAGL